MSIQADVIKLKKEIHNLREHNADLIMDLDEKNQKLGKIESEYLKMKNETLLITKTKLMNHQEIIRQNVEKLLDNERERISFLEKNYEEALKKISYFEQEKQNLESHRKELQIENNGLKKQLQEIGKKTLPSDYLNEIKSRDETLNKQTKDYQKIVKEWNELCDRMEDLMSENRLLRELANVPENYGINLEEIKIGDKMKIEDYKAKIRILQREVDDLETERAQLKHKLVFFANSLEIKEPPFSMLTTEQKRVVAEYAQSLYEGRDFIIPERYELIKENGNLKNKIEMLEKQIGSLHLETNYKIYGYNNSKPGEKSVSPGKLPEGINEIVDMLRKENEDLKALLNKSLDKFSMMNEGNAYSYKNSSLPEKNNIHFKNDKQGFPQGINYNNIISPGISSGNPNQNNNANIAGLNDYTYAQLPPVPIIDQKDIDNTSFSYSYRFNTKIKIDPNQLHTFFGIAKNDEDVTELKIESASLQTQLIETLEILARMQAQDEFLHTDFERLYNKLDNLVLMQNELFDRYSVEKLSYTAVMQNNANTNKSLLEELQEAKRKLKAYEDTIALIEAKNPSMNEVKVMDKIKENAVLDMNYIKLTRKYESLFEEENKLRILLDDFEKSSLEKDKQLESTIIKLKEWKQILSFYNKFLIKKLKKSVDRDEFDRVIEENKYLREKHNEIVLRDINITRHISLVENSKIKLKEMEENYFSAEEMRIDSEIELFYLKKKLQDSDPEFHLQEITLRKFLKKLSENRISFSEMRRIFDPDNSGKITKLEFTFAIKKLGINEILSNEKELTFLIRSLNYDEEENIDTFYFLRKLERVGLVDEKDSKNPLDEQILTNFIQGVRNSGMTLKSVFELFDTSGDGIISKEEFKFALQQLKMNVSDEILSRIIIMINSDRENTVTNSNTSYTGNNIPGFENSAESNEISIKYAKFCELFDQNERLYNLKSRKNAQIKSTLKIDWKTNMISNIVEAIKANKMSFTDAFKFLDKDNSGQISKAEFYVFLSKISVVFTDIEVDALYKMLDMNNDGTVALDEFLSILKDCERKIQMFRNMTNQAEDDPYSNNRNTDRPVSTGNNQAGMNPLPTTGSILPQKEIAKLYNKSSLLQEKEKYFSYKINQMRKRLEEMERINKDTSSQLEEYVRKHAEIMNKYFTAGEELQRLKSLYESSGVKREDLQKIDMDNDNLNREVAVLRVGLNTFKDLYSSSTRQTHILTLKSQRNADELETFKKAIKDLQSESNSNALLGKLYYSLLLSRWRESNTLRKCTDLNSDFASFREENFRLESENKQMIKEISELQTVLHDKIIENLRLEDNLQNHTQGFNQGNPVTTEHLEELKILIKELSNEKTILTEKYFTLRKDNLKIETECEELRSKVEYSEALVRNLKISSSENNTSTVSAYNSNSNTNYNYNEFSKRLIQISEDLSKSKLQESIVNRENVFMKERESYLEKLIEHLNNSVKNFEIANTEWEGKFRKMEEIWRRRDEERQKKFFDNVRSLNIGDMKTLTAENTTSGKLANISGKKLTDIDTKVKELEDTIQIKNSEINRLLNINKENEELLSERLRSGIDLDGKINLLSKNSLDILKDDETQLVAQTAHKTIKTLQDLLNSKSIQLVKKDEVIENLKNDLVKLKSSYLDHINKLHEQIEMDNESTMTKLKTVLNTLDQNLLIKISKSHLSTMTLADIEALLEEKDMTIKTLALELNKSKEESDLNYVKIQNLSMQNNELMLCLNEQKFSTGTGVSNQKEEIERLKKIINEKSYLIDEERAKIKRITEDFCKKQQDKTILEDQLFKSSLYIPERLEMQSEKTEMYQKIQNLRNKNKKFRNEIEKLNKYIEELKRVSEENMKTVEKSKNENKLFLQNQIKDTKILSKLKKEKEEILGEKEKLKEKCDGLQFMINNQNVLNNDVGTGLNTPNILQQKATLLNQPNRRPQSSAKIKTISKADLSTEEKINLKPTQEPFTHGEIKPDQIPAESILKKLVYYCIRKNINMQRHLQRYDLSKLGKITKSDFSKAIEELKLGFMESDVQKIQDSLNCNDIYIPIADIVNKMILEDKNYELLIKENENSFDPTALIRKQQSKKYFSLENKNFNINY